MSFLLTIQKFIFASGPFFLLLGVLIFIHELGHFLAARYFGVKVEVFSLGFGPKILKYKKGDTTYCISLFPLGGYVKMFGDNPLTKVPDKEKSKGFLYKKVHEKWIIAFAGPLMNLIFSLLLFLFVALNGSPSIPPVVGDIDPLSPAHSAGFRSGDKILSVNGQSLSHYEEISQIIKKKAGERLVFQVKSQTNEIKTVTIAPVLRKNPLPWEWNRSVGSIKGLSPASKGLRIGVIHDSSAHRAGLRSFDEITKVNGRGFRYWRDLKAFIQNENEILSFTVKRELKANKKATSKKTSLSQEKTIVLPAKSGQKASLLLLGIEPADLYIDRIGPGTPAEIAGLLRGDRIIAINGNMIKGWKQILKTVESSEGQALSIKYRRENQEKTVSISPKPLFVENNIKTRFMLGIGSGGTTVLPEEIIWKRPLSKAGLYSVQETWKQLNHITAGLVRLAQREISLRTMGGPVLIGRVAHSQFHQGLSSFLYMMAFISLNLFFINLLPIPMLDGGHLLFFTLEGILRRPLSVKKILVAQQLGLFFLLSFMAFVFFNDIYNWLKAW